MSSTATIALSIILILLSLTKIVLLWSRPALWFRFIRRIYERPERTRLVALAAASLTLGLLLQAGLDIIQILAVCLFMSLMLIVGIAPYAPRLLEWIDSCEIRAILREQALYTAAWLILLGWGVYRLLST